VSQDNRFQYISSRNQLAQVMVLDAMMSDFSYTRHAHEEYSLGVTLKGRQDFFCHNAFYKSPTGGVLFFNPDDVHDGHSGIAESLEYVMIYIHPDELRPLFQALGYDASHLLRLRTPLIDDPILRYQILALRHLLNHENHSVIEFETCLFRIARSMVNRAGYREGKTTRRSRKDTLMLRAKDFIIANLAEDLSIDDIARAVSMSKFHFIRLFSQQFSITPHQYVLNCRINFARKALQVGLPSSQVALESGFSDSSHLNRYFKRIYGMTPKQYQLQLRYHS
jgi:AraC-like DNA-binding protein